jgi:hypothetical protein
MAGVRFDKSLLTASVRQGVELHHATDTAFHALEAFHQGCASLRASLGASGIATGPARAIGHAGYELLLDGCLLERPGVADEFTDLLASAPSVVGAVSSGDDERFAQLVDSLRDDRWWLGYKDPQLVAQGLYRRLQHRPRLRVTSTEVAAVSAALEKARPAIDEAVEMIVAAVAEALRLRAVQ